MRTRSVIWGIVAGLGVAWLCCLPRELFRDVSYSTVVESAEGELLGARIAADEQWRFPPSDTVPERYATALIQFEDRAFRWHPGVNPVALHVVSGGSTLTMQVIRLSRQKERTLWQKTIEAVQATRLELRYSKKQILALYAAHAPYGGNVVGLEAAAWRYFGRPAAELSWAEAATLAILPNAPGSLHLSNDFRDRLVTLVRYHDISLRTESGGINTDRSFLLRRLNKFGEEDLRAIFLIHCSDRTATGYTTREREDLRLKERMAALDALLAEQPCFTLKDLAVNGRDLLAAGLKGKAVGEALQTLLEAVMDGKVPNEKEKLLKYLNHI